MKHHYRDSKSQFVCADRNAILDIFELMGLRHAHCHKCLVTYVIGWRP